MEAEPLDAAVLLSGRKKRHILLRGIAEFIDVVVVGLVIVPIEVLSGGVGIALPALGLYFVVTESLYGCTLGKRICGLRVIGLNGRTPTPFQCLVRNLFRPIEGFGLLGIILVAFTDKGQRLGDLAASTFVVRFNELDEVAHGKQALTTNKALSSRHVVSLSPSALALARSGIAASTRPAQTGLSVTECAGGSHSLTVQYDLLEPDDSMWQWTTDDVTVSVGKELAEKYGSLMIDAQDGKLIVTSAVA